MLRIIGGDLRRRLIHTPPDAETTRPMPDRVRESVFNLLRGHTEDAEVFDGFAGSGAIGFEAISRGARHVLFVERDRRVAQLIERTAADLGVVDRCEIVVGDALGAAAVARCPEGVHLVFFDPPYPIVRDPAQWPRLRDQFARLVQRLDDTGYGVLRTPWPFFHVLGGEAEEPSPAPRARARAARLDKTDDEEDFAGWDDITEGAPDMEIEIIDLNAEKPKESHVPVDLRIPGTLGPETHVYGSTAVHLFMRDPAGADGSGG